MTESGNPEIAKVIEMLKITNELLFCLVFINLPGDQLDPVAENVYANFKKRFPSLK